jgi:hypothetical protein
MSALKILANTISIGMLTLSCGQKPSRIHIGSGAAIERTQKDSEAGASVPLPLPPASSLQLSPSITHRLNRFEYNNAVEDLFGLGLKPANDFPEDPITQGFDNIAETLSITPALFDLLTQSAEKIATASLKDHPRTDLLIDPVAASNGMNGNPLGKQWNIIGTMPISFKLDQDETINLLAYLGGTAYRAPTPVASLKLDGKPLATKEIKAPGGDPEAISFSGPLAKGEHTLTISFDNRAPPDAVNASFNQMVLDRVEIVSQATVITKLSQKMLECKKTAQASQCLQDIYLDLASRAWRRPLSAQEKTDLISLWNLVSSANGTEAEAMKGEIQAILLSPKFLFRTAEASGTKTKGIAEIDDYSLASRLSFFLWSSLPDETLLSAAAKGELRDGLKLRDQVRRMLGDPKTQRFLTNFASQWLYTRPLARAERDQAVFKTFDSELKAALAAESQLVFADFLSNGKRVKDLLSPGFTYANDKLAIHYGLKAPGSREMKKVPVEDNVRGGILTHGAWLTLKSEASDTVPVKRGAWILENLTCFHIPAPPAVPPLEPPPPGDKKVSTRERFEKHLSNKSCASCHNLIDPIGFGLEAYDPTGALRNLDYAGNPVDTKGNYRGSEFADAKGLAKILGDSGEFEKCLIEKLYTYSLGRSVDPSDTKILEDIRQKFRSEGESLDKLIEQIILSPAFRMSDFGEAL